MTGIERLREHGDKYQERIEGLANDMRAEAYAIADQIERERACDSDTAENIRLIVGGVVDEMESHCLGHEGMKDSPVARWARELREALGATVSRRESDGVADSPYDAILPEDRDAIAWVCEHGGIESVKAQRYESMPRAAYERKKAGFLDHIAECESALGRRNERISELEERVRVRERANDELNEELNAMRPRLMPEGMEWLVEAWPRFEDGSPVHFGDVALIDGEVDMVEAVQLWIHGKPIIYGDGGSQQLERGERVKRPVADTWERLEEDAWSCTCVMEAIGLVRRARALAERERGE